MVFTDYTWQDWKKAGCVDGADVVKASALQKIINVYKASDTFTHAL